IGIGEDLVLQAQRVQLLHPLCQRRVHECPNERLRKGAVKREVGFRYASGGGEPSLIGRIISAKRADIVQRSFLAPHHPTAGRKIRIGSISSLGLEHRLVETGRQRVDQVDVTGKLAVLFFCNAAGNEDAEMADALVDRIDDRLPVGADFVDVLVQIENPSESLLGRRDVIALGAEHHDGRADIAEVDRYSVRCLYSAGGEVVADEQLVDDELDLLGVEIDVTSPPALKT